MSEVDTRWYGEVARRLFETNHDKHDMEFDPDYWPREPSQYTPTDHFINKKKDNKRHIDGKFIRECIEEGEIIPTYGTKAIFHKEFYGVSFYLVVGAPKDGNSYFEAVSMYPWVKSKGEAITSGMWTHEEVEDIRELNKEYMNRDQFQDYFRRTNLHAEIEQ